MRLAIHFARLGPYHLARLESAVEVLGPIGWEVLALETAGVDATYAWERTGSGGSGFQRKTVFPEGVFERIPAGELRAGIFRALDELRPDAVAVAGWGTVDARACLAWCKKNGARAIVMSETRAADGRRVWWREWVKSRIVRKFDGALCGGESHRRYLEELGMPREKIKLGYNVVDNEFFARIRNAKWGMRNAECRELVAWCGRTGPFFWLRNVLWSGKIWGGFWRLMRYMWDERVEWGAWSGERFGLWFCWGMGSFGKNWRIGAGSLGCERQENSLTEARRTRRANT